TAGTTTTIGSGPVAATGASRARRHHAGVRAGATGATGARRGSPLARQRLAATGGAFATSTIAARRRALHAGRATRRERVVPGTWTRLLRALLLLAGIALVGTASHPGAVPAEGVVPRPRTRLLGTRRRGGRRAGPGCRLRAGLGTVSAAGGLIRDRKSVV